MNEKISAGLALVSVLVAIFSLVIGFFAYRVAADSTDIKAAIQNLSTLATESKRQSAATRDQLAAMQAQVAALQAQADEAKAQTKAIAEQTAAIRASSDANIRSADAQRELADTTARGQRPDVTLRELQVSGFTAAPNEHGSVPITLFWRFANSGGGAFTAKQVRYTLIFGPHPPTAFPDQMLRFDGQGVVVTPAITSAFAPKDPLPLMVAPTTAKAVIARQARVFFLAEFDFVDQAGTLRTRAFGRELLISDGASEHAIPTGGDALNWGPRATR